MAVAAANQRLAEQPGHVSRQLHQRHGGGGKAAAAPGRFGFAAGGLGPASQVGCLGRRSEGDRTEPGSQEVRLGGEIRGQGPILGVYGSLGVHSRARGLETGGSRGSGSIEAWGPGASDSGVLRFGGPRRILSLGTRDVGPNGDRSGGPPLPPPTAWTPPPRSNLCAGGPGGGLGSPCAPQGAPPAPGNPQMASVMVVEERCGVAVPSVTQGKKSLAYALGRLGAPL